MIHYNETELHLTVQMELLDQHGMCTLNQTLLQNARLIRPSIRFLLDLNIET